MTRKLHIGGKTTAPGWEVLNIVPGPHVDHLCDASDLSMFEDNIFAEIYASHIVEHLDYVDEITNTLIEWHRVLAPGGRLYVSVPNLDVLARLFISKDNFTTEERFELMRMIFGGHVDQYDYHVVGLNLEFLLRYLSHAGYVNIREVERFGLFDDASNIQVKSVPISLNIIAEKAV